MDPTLKNVLEMLFRWIHVVAGIAWIGHLYFFNFVNSQLVKTYDADSKKKVLPELMPRALYWFRWGALFTWATGILLAGLVYYMGYESVMKPTAPGSHDLGAGAAIGISLALILVPFFLYDALWKSPLGKNENAGVGICFAITVAIAFGLSQVMSGRSAFVHLGAMFGSVMFMNVWMRIWPAQRKIIAGVKGTAAAPDAAIPAMAGLRSKHNTYMSVPLVFFMLAPNHFALVGDAMNWAIAAGVIALGFGATKFLYVKAASAAPAQF